MTRTNNQGRWMNEENMKTGKLIDTRCGGQQGKGEGGGTSMIRCDECGMSTFLYVKETIFAALIHFSLNFSKEGTDRREAQCGKNAVSDFSTRGNCIVLVARADDASWPIL
ncbi:hypothetical protein HYDPIDRAFT_107478 [Hydnomerulius pinastri MD-312]|nr:hypothetical protein HYDPIDRAFT_107478 [Hydnomerulius pinastri MD-312]